MGITVHDEAEGIKAIKDLPKAGRLHLMHVFRNGLQNIVSMVELDQKNEAIKYIHEFSGELRKLDL